MFLTSMSGKKQVTQMFPKTLDWLVGVVGRGRVRRHQPEEAVQRFEGFPVKISFIEPTPEDPKIISGFSQKQQHGQQILSRNQCRNCFSLFQFESARLIKF